MATTVPTATANESCESTADIANSATSVSVEDEISAIKTKYGTTCKIIRNNGDYAYIVQVTFDDYGIVLKFQITDEYPLNAPVSIITWKRTPIDISVDSILRTLVSTQTTITQMLQSAENCLRGRTELKLQKIDNETRKRKGKKKHPKKNDETFDTKKASMKTASDVISRILWDQDLQSDLFTVGYVDRFLGIVEKAFCILSWDDPASVDDYEALAIPKHRIAYFKYKDFIVWEKSSRTDYVFGSSGTRKMTIYDVIAQYDDLVVKTAPSPAAGTVENDENDSDSDSDDGIVISLGNNNYDQNRMAHDNDVNDENSDSEDPYWRNKLRPNYFIAVRIHDPEIVSMVDYVQDILVSRQPRYDSCCIPLTALHITLCTVRLDSEEQVRNCSDALTEIRAELSELKTALTLEGTAMFYSRVLYAKVHYDSKFLQMVDAIKLALRVRGIELLDGQDFVPHMTIMKTSRPVSRVIGKDIPKYVYAGAEEVDFGKHMVDNINLCSIEDQWGEDGFYQTPLRLEL